MSDRDRGFLEELRRMEKEKGVTKGNNNTAVGVHAEEALKSDIVGNPELKFHFVQQQPQILLMIGATAETCTQCLKVTNFSGQDVATMSFDGVITAHVADPVKEINEMLASEIANRWECGQMRAYLLLLRAYFTDTKSRDWRKNPML